MDIAINHDYASNFVANLFQWMEILNSIMQIMCLYNILSLALAIFDIWFDSNSDVKFWIWYT